MKKPYSMSEGITDDPFRSGIAYFLRSAEIEKAIFVKQARPAWSRGRDNNAMDTTHNKSVFFGKLRYVRGVQFGF